VDLAITNATLLTLQGEGVGAVENGAVGIDGGELIYVDPSDGEFLRADVEGLHERARARARDVFETASDGWRAAGSALVEDADAGRL